MLSVNNALGMQGRVCEIVLYVHMLEVAKQHARLYEYVLYIPYVQRSLYILPT